MRAAVRRLFWCRAEERQASPAAPTTRLRSRPSGPAIGSSPGPNGGVSGSGNGSGPSPKVAHGGPPASLDEPDAEAQLVAQHGVGWALGQVAAEIVGRGLTA